MRNYAIFYKIKMIFLMKYKTKKKKGNHFKSSLLQKI